VRACTFLPYVGEADWTDDVTSAVEEFVARADRRTLCLFYENGALKATFRVPGARTDAFAWFLKSAAVDGRDDARLDEANFSRRVSFGKVDTPVEKTMFLLLDSLYSPFVFSWTAGILFITRPIENVMSTARPTYTGSGRRVMAFLK